MLSGDAMYRRRQLPLSGLLAATCTQGSGRMVNGGQSEWADSVAVAGPFRRSIGCSVSVVGPGFALVGA